MRGVGGGGGVSREPREPPQPTGLCNDMYPLEFVVQLLNRTRDDPLDEVLLKMNLCSTERGMFGHQKWFRSEKVSFKSGLLTRR